MKLSSIAAIGVSVKEIETLSVFLEALENNLPSGCAIVVFCTDSTSGGAFTRHIYRATSLPIEVALPNTPLRQGTVFVIPNGETLIVNNQTIMLQNTGLGKQNNNTPIALWQSLPQNDFAGIAAILIDAQPNNLQYLAEINQIGGITILCHPENTNPIAANIAANFNYVLPAADAAHAAAQFLQLFATPGTETETPPPNKPQTETQQQKTIQKFQQPPTSNNTTYIQPELQDLLNATQTALLFFDEQLHLLQYNTLAKQYADNLEQVKTLADINLNLYFPTLLTDAAEVLQSGTQAEFYLPTNHGVLTHILIFPRTHPSGICLALSPVSQSQLLSHRFTLLANELEKQGIEQIKTILQLRREIEINEQQRELLESILANMGEGVLATDENENIILLNSMAKQITGLQKSGMPLAVWMQQYTLFDPITAATAEPHQNPFTRCLQGQSVTAEEWYVINNQTKQSCYWQIIASPYKTNVKANNSGTVIVISDISTRKKAEIELINSELTKKALLEAIPDLLFRVNKEGLYLDYLPAKSDSHIPPAAFLGNKLTDFMPDEVSADIMETLHKSLETLQIQTFPFEHVSNVIKFYEARFSPINHEEALGIVRDVTDMIVGKDAIRRGTRHYQKLLRVSTFPILISNRKGEIINANPAAAGLLGAASETELIGKHIEDFVLRKHRITIREAIKEGFIEALTLSPLRITLLTLQGKEIETEVSGSVITFENQLAAQMVMHNLSEQVHWEKQFHLLFDNAADCMAIIDIKKIQFIQANKTLQNFVGAKKAKDIVRKKWIQFSPSHQSNGSLSAVLIKELLKDAKEGFSFRWQFETLSGKNFAAEVTLLGKTNASDNEYTVLIKPEKG